YQHFRRIGLNGKGFPIQWLSRFIQKLDVYPQSFARSVFYFINDYTFQQTLCHELLVERIKIDRFGIESTKSPIRIDGLLVRFQIKDARGHCWCHIEVIDLTKIL